MLDEATEDFRLQLVQEDEEGEEVLSIDRISADTSPIIKLVDSTVFNAIQRRASDIHIEALDTEVVIKYRIDGALYHAMEPIDKRHHQTIISRIKVMAGSTSPRSASRRTAASSFACAAAPSTSASR